MDDTNRFDYFLLGLGIGTVSALFFAPKSGTETRNYLQAKARGGTDYVKRQGGELRDRATETIERGTQSLRDQLKSLSDVIDAGKQAYRKVVETHASVSTPMRPMPSSDEVGLGTPSPS
jgi:gas vesicle protein